MWDKDPETKPERVGERIMDTLPSDRHPDCWSINFKPDGSVANPDLSARV